MIISTKRTALANGPEVAISAGTVPRPPPLHCNSQIRCIERFTFLVKSFPDLLDPGSSPCHQRHFHGERFVLHASTAFAKGSRESGCGLAWGCVNTVQKPSITPSPCGARLATLPPQLYRGSRPDREGTCRPDPRRSSLPCFLPRRLAFRTLKAPPHKPPHHSRSGPSRARSSS